MNTFVTSSPVTTCDTKARLCFTLRNETDEPAAEIIIDGVIGDGFFSDTTTTSNALREAIKAIPAGRPISVRINSQGGSIVDGLGMYHALRERENVTCYVTGYAASIASVLMLSGSRCVIPKAAIVMIHEAWVLAQGNADSMEKTIEMLRKNDDVIAQVYAQRTGKPVSYWRKAMKDETWLTGEEACKLGLGEMSEHDVSKNLQAVDIKNLRAPTHILNMISGTAGMTKRKDENSMDPQTATPAAPAAPMNAELEAMKAQLAAITAQNDALRLARVKESVDKALTETRITADQVGFWTKAGLDDEASMKVMLALNPAHVNAPIAPSGARVLGTRLEQINAIQNVNERWNAIRLDYDDLVLATPRNDNTYSPTLVTSFLTPGMVVKLQNRWAPLAAFMRDFSMDPYKPNATHVVRLVTAGATAQTNATNFESGDSTVDVVSVTMARKSVGFHVTTGELNSGMRMENLLEVNAAVMADTLIGLATAPITTANFTGDAIVSAPEAFGWADMTTGRGQLKKSPIKNAILDGEYFARLTNTPSYFQRTPTESGSNGWSAFGWDAIYESTLWTSAGTNVRGFICNPQAIALVAGLPLEAPNVPGNTLAQTTFTVPGVGISIAQYQWFSLATRTFWQSYECMFGASKADATAGFVIKSA